MDSYECEHDRKITIKTNVYSATCQS